MFCCMGLPVAYCFVLTIADTVYPELADLYDNYPVPEIMAQGAGMEFANLMVPGLSEGVDDASSSPLTPPTRSVFVETWIWSEAHSRYTAAHYPFLSTHPSSALPLVFKQLLFLLSPVVVTLMFPLLLHS